MANGSQEREQELFQACLDLPPTERGRYLQRTCAEDPALLARIERLLAAHQRAEHQTLRPMDAVAGDDRPDLIGPYRITGVLGEGGSMGIVYAAEQIEPVQRRVALKIVRLGMDTEAVVARFMTERQALAAMDHPYVAKVFDAGQSSGRPYFVMERVDGVPLTAYCDDARLSVRQRIELFMKVCHAVEHAHQKGVIHRDLKPSNVLVGTQDGVPVPRVIDFGVAKAVGLDVPGRGTDVTLATETLGTPAYMSPEQAGRAGLDVDTRTDVYSLGVILYELLTGHLPAAPSDAGYIEFLAALARGDLEPVRPSTRAGGGEPADDDAALRRSTTAEALRKQLADDLDWIVMKALEKDRERRYDSARELADDLRRHLAHEPVSAGPPSRTYRLRKLARRHRTTVAAAGLGLFALVLGLVAAATQAIRATRAERTARAEAETARRVSDFLVELFQVSAPGVAKGNTITARDLLDRGASRIREELGDQPLVRARLQTVIGDTYRRLGAYEPARPLLEEALATRDLVLGAENVEAVRTLHALARLDHDVGNDKAAEEGFRAALARLAKAPRPDPVEYGLVRRELAFVLVRKARYAEAEVLHQQALEGLTSELGPAHREVGASWDGLGMMLAQQRRFGEAEAAFRSALKILEGALGADHPQVAVTLMNLSTLLGDSGRDAEGEGYLVRAVAVFEKAYGPTHRMVANGLSSLGLVYGRQGRYEDAEVMFRRGLAVREQVFGRDHPRTAGELKILGQNYLRKADFETARRTLERALAIDRKARDPDHPETAWTETQLGDLELCLARLDEADAAYRRSLAALDKTLGPDHPATADSLAGMGKVAMQRKRLDEADVFLTRARTAAAKDNPTNPQLLPILNALAELRLRQGRLEDAAQELEGARLLQEKVLRPGHPSRSETLVLFAQLLVAQGRPADAPPLLREAVEVAEKGLGPDHPEVARALHALGALRGQHGSEGEAASLVKRALDIRRARLGRDHPDTRETAELYARLTSRGRESREPQSFRSARTGSVPAARRPGT